MKRVLEVAWVVALICTFAAACGEALASGGGNHGKQMTAYRPSAKGVVAGYRLAGIEPDGDPLNQVVLQTRLAASDGVPATHLIVDSYLENFQPDTTPILPDLLNPKQNAQNLGGFLQGKALLTDDAGSVLYIGSFLAEAFLDNSNHAVARLEGSGAAYGGSLRLKGTFRLRKDGSLSGAFQGQILLPPAAKHQIIARRGARMKPLKQIISVVTVKPAPMMGKATTGSPKAALHTGYGPQPSHSGQQISTWMIAAGIAVAAIFLATAVLFWRVAH